MRMGDLFQVTFSAIDAFVLLRFSDTLLNAYFALVQKLVGSILRPMKFF